MPQKRKTTNRLFFSVSRKIHKSVRYDSDILLSNRKTLLSELNEHRPSFRPLPFYLFSTHIQYTHSYRFFFFFCSFSVSVSVCVSSVALCVYVFVSSSLCSAEWLCALFFSSIDRRVSNSICLLLTTQFKSRCDLCNRDPFTCTHTHKSRKFFKLQFRKCFSRSQCNIGCELSWVVSFWFLNLLWWGSRTNWRI